MRVLVADCETDGLLDELTKLHCLAYYDLETDKVHSFADQPGYTPIEQGLRELAEADMTVWHNGIKFDVPAIRKVYPWWKPQGIVRDSMLTASLVYPKNPTLFEIDKRLIKKGKLTPRLMGSHALKAWGMRCGEWKGEYDGGWEHWSVDMHLYCEQDVRSTAALWRKLTKELAEWKSQECVDIEHEVAWLCARQERQGVGFDMEAAARLLGSLMQRKTELENELQSLFPPKTMRLPFTPKASNKTKGWVKGVQTWKEKTIVFKPSSRQQVADRLLELGALFTEKTEKGGWKIDDDILLALPFDEAKALAKLFEIDKRVGTLSSGKQSLMKHGKNGRIHGRINTNGAVTGRATHSSPNVNVPKVGNPYGKEFRELFVAPKGKIMVGTDADGLEARVEAGFTVRYDGGSYRDMILLGSKEDGTDLHSRNRDALLTVKKGVTRDTAKTTKYAWTYGAGDPKLGQSVGAKGPRDVLARVGKKVRIVLLDASPGLKGLVEAVERAVKKRPYLWGIDGRKLAIRSSHAAVNTLFQSTGSIIFKKAMIICDTELSGVLPSVIGTQGIEAATRYVPGDDYEQVLWVHDETQHECKVEIAKIVGNTMADAIRKAGEHFNFACPMAGNSDLGRNWAETH